MNILLLFILLIIWLIYYSLKGIILFDKSSNKVIFIVTITTELLALILVSNLDNGILKYILLIYFIYSFSEYIFNSLIKKGNKSNIKAKFPTIPYMSKIEIINGSVHINYKLFKPIILVILNIYLFLKKQPTIGFDDEFSIEVNTKDGTKVDIKV